MTSTFAGHFEDPPRDATGRPIPNVAFQLYLLGTKTSPVYYTDRLKSDTVEGDPTSNEYGNVDIWVEPGIYEYWYDGGYLQEISIGEDNSEDDVALAAAVATINAFLTTRPTFDEMNAAVAGGGGPGLGAELTVNKGAVDGYAGLDGDGFVPLDNIAEDLKVGTRPPSAHASSHAPDGADPLQFLFGTSVIPTSTNQTLTDGGSVYVVDATAGHISIALPSITDGVTYLPIVVKKIAGPYDVIISGAIDDDVDNSITMSLLNHSIIFVARHTEGSGVWQAVGGYIPIEVVARLDKVNDFNNNQITNFKEKVVTVTGATYTAGTDGWGLTLRCTNAGGATVTLPNSAAVGDWLVIQQAAAGQVTIASGAGASFSEPDSYTKTAKQSAGIFVKCLRNDDFNSAVYVVGGYTAS